MRLDFFVLADGASAPDGKVYIHGGAITRVFPTGFPATTVMAAVTRLLFDADEIGGEPRPFTIELAEPEQDSWQTIGDVGLVPEEPAGGAREGEDLAIIVVAGLVISFSRPGSYRFRVMLGSDELAVRRVYVTELDDPSHPNPPEAQESSVQDPMSE